MADDDLPWVLIDSNHTVLARCLYPHHVLALIPTHADLGWTIRYRGRCVWTFADAQSVAHHSIRETAVALLVRRAQESEKPR